MPAHSAAVPLVVGAGPVGKAAALLLAQADLPVRLVDGAPGPATESRALAVNPRTLEILQPTGVSDRMLELGLPIRAASLWRGKQRIVRIGFDRLHHRHPFMLALSQATTERLLGEALQAAGVVVEWDTALVACRNEDQHVAAQLQTGAATEEVQCPWLLAADGAHSAARQALGVDFAGNGLEAPWQLLDLPLETDLAEDHAHVFLVDDGFVFLLRVVDGGRRDAPPLWRVLGNVPDLLGRVDAVRPAGEPVWTSHFHVAHRLAARLQVGNVCLAGDAAHVHSPMGARGMNLGIEDAWAFGRLAASGRLADYGAVRRPVDARVVRQVERFTKMFGARSLPARALRWALTRLFLRVPAVQRRLLAVLTGLDHPLAA